MSESEWVLGVPEKDGMYIVSLCGVSTAAEYRGGCWCWIDNGKTIPFRISAWRKFPKPYTPEENKKSPSAATEKGDTEITGIEYHTFPEKAKGKLFEEIMSYMDKAIAKGKEEGSAWEYQSCVAPYYNLQDFIKNLLLDYLINGLGEK